jgi:hypothetical protein
MAGRKVKLNDELEERFLRAIRLGCPIKDACGCAGIGETTYFKWMQWADSDRKDARRYQEFRDRIKEAEGEATQAWLAIIEKAARDGSWQAAAWKLERRRGMVATVKQELSGANGGPIKTETTDARQALLDRLASIAERDQEI